MRERTTWNRSASRSKVADPYLMNQDHVSLQPGPDDYVIGDPSDFAEDIHPSKDTWEAEYAGGQVKRNEIGMAEMRKDTFNHPEKTAADHGLLLKKADLCIKTASMMLGAAAREAAVEDQAVALMHMPDSDLIHTFNRLAAEGKQGEDEGDDDEPNAQQKKAYFRFANQDDDGDDDDGEEAQAAQQHKQQQQKKKANQQQVATVMQMAQQCLANGDVQAAQGCMAQLQSVAQGCMANGDFATAQSCMAQAQQLKNAIQQQAAQIQSGQGQVLANWRRFAQQQQQGDDEPQAQSKQQKKANQALAQAIQALQQQAGQNPQVAQALMALQNAQAANQPQGQVAQGQPQVPVGMMGQQVGNDSAMADMLLMDQGDMGMGMGMSEMGLEMEPSMMDVGDMGMGPEDDVLMTLFASEQEKDQGQGQGQGQQQKKQAMARTASTRTVGTRPSQGVSRVGGGFGGGSNDVNKLAALWPSAPDVSDAFRLSRGARGG
jgi:hypothetical protein